MYNLSMSKIMISPSADVYLNLACEDKLFADYDGEPLLFLWRNHNAIVIGKWQNAWKECNAAEAERDGIKIARRLTGGGAVFHDLNNLNYTFIANEKDYDVLRQCEVVRKALLALGIKAEISGRNDLTTNGFKVTPLSNSPQKASIRCVRGWARFACRAPQRAYRRLPRR